MATSLEWTPFTSKCPILGRNGPAYSNSIPGSGLSRHGAWQPRSGDFRDDRGHYTRVTQAISRAERRPGRKLKQIKLKLLRSFGGTPTQDEEWIVTILG